MNTFFRNAVLGLTGAALIIGPSVASAATSTATIQVQAAVVKNCLVSANNLPFGTYNPLAADLDVNTTVSVRCTSGTPYTVSLSTGLTAGSTFVTRLMTDGTSFMQYNLYTDVGRTTVFGDGSGATATVGGTGAGLAVGNAQTVTIYGRIPTGQDTLTIGNYAETSITVTVTY